MIPTSRFENEQPVTQEMVDRWVHLFWDCLRVRSLDPIRQALENGLKPINDEAASSREGGEANTLGCFIQNTFRSTLTHDQLLEGIKLLVEHGAKPFNQELAGPLYPEHNHIFGILEYKLHTRFKQNIRDFGVNPPSIERKLANLDTVS